ncbi:MAG TPA: ATP-binding protein [Planctomycetaceae bacterium]|nr:ATP-binding protein [Planctomycetaceae bacterium]
MDARLAKATKPVTRPANRQMPSPGDKDASASPGEISGRRSAIQDGRAKILLVDDRPANLLAYEVILEELGEELIMAHSGEEALKQLRIHDFAVILLDVSMPGMDGFETAKAIRESETRVHTPIIFLTAYSDDLKSAEAYAHGAVDYIQTPVIPPVLRAKVKVFADFIRMTEELNLRRHQEVVKEGVDRLRLILDSSLDAVVTIDEQGRISGWNPHAETVFGWTRDEAMGAMLADLIIPEPYRFAFVHGLEHYRATGEGPLLRRRLELTAIRKGDVTFPVELAVSPLHLGEHCEFCAFVRDISQRKAAEEQVRRYATELERSNRELNDFAYSASHDLRSPLRAIGQIAAWIGEDHGSELSEDVRNDLGLMQRRVQRMQSLLDDMLEFARVGRSDGDLSHVDCGQLAREIIETLPLPAGFTIEVGSMPTILTHRTPLHQVLRNLIGNAVKHHNRPDGRVEVSSMDHGNQIEFIVHDDGPGIAQDYHDQIFRMFTTLKPRDAIEGSGMGLALVKKIVEGRGGAIQLESAEGRGATFRFTWPRSAEG